MTRHYEGPDAVLHAQAETDARTILTELVRPISASAPTEPVT